MVCGHTSAPSDPKQALNSLTSLVKFSWKVVHHEYIFPFPYLYLKTSILAGKFGFHGSDLCYCLLGYDNIYKLTEMNLQEHKQH